MKKKREKVSKHYPSLSSSSSQSLERESMAYKIPLKGCSLKIKIPT